MYDKKLSIYNSEGHEIMQMTGWEMYDTKLSIYSSEGHKMMQMAGGKCMTKMPIQTSEGHKMMQLTGGRCLAQICQIGVNIQKIIKFKKLNQKTRWSINYNSVLHD